MLLFRLLTASLLIAAAVYCFSFSAYSVISLLFLCLFIFFAAAEFAGLRWCSGELGNVEERKRPPLLLGHFAYGAICAIAVIVEYTASAQGRSHAGLAFLSSWLGVAILCATPFLYFAERNLNRVVQHLIDLLAGLFYIAIPGVMLSKLALLTLPYAPRAGALYFTLAVVFMGDTGAYFTGRLCGRHKLIPRVSPKKTVEGSVGGLVWSAMTSLGFSLYFQLTMPWWLAIIAGLVIGVAGQIGDLIESALKRAANCKDSSQLLPGHGGVLDRIDSLLFAGPLAYVLFLSLGYA